MRRDSPEEPESRARGSPEGEVSALGLPEREPGSQASGLSPGLPGRPPTGLPLPSLCDSPWLLTAIHRWSPGISLPVGSLFILRPLQGHVQPWALAHLQHDYLLCTSLTSGGCVTPSLPCGAHPPKQAGLRAPRSLLRRSSASQASCLLPSRCWEHLLPRELITRECLLSSGTNGRRAGKIAPLGGCLHCHVHNPGSSLASYTSGIALVLWHFSLCLHVSLSLSEHDCPAW